ncbi:MAG: recombinase family protein, partial [Monoglobaceae bacterium]
IDRVLTKSISRFARNTADALMYARILRNCGVSILFEKENIDTAYMSSELLLAISGAQAQEESISISKNMRWSAEKRMQNGTFIASMTPYGYELKDGELEIIDEEAEIVKLIFSSFLSGMGKQKIAVMLGKRNVPKRFGYPEWRINTVDYILRNERYIGDARF